jgi:hypothetical protein
LPVEDYLHDKITSPKDIQNLTGRHLIGEKEIIGTKTLSRTGAEGKEDRGASDTSKTLTSP